MPQILLEMTKELVAEQIRQYKISSDKTQSLLRETHGTLLTLYYMEMSGSTEASPPKEDAEESWRRSITKHAIRCMECGNSFRQLSRRHLRIHDLDARSYREKYGIPRTQALSSFTATARRRELAKQIKPWEKAAKGRQKRASKRT
ncbi:MAG: hypothetical protein ETSY1_43235 [Candidatus Entotheonella factor]|uniref:Transcriptional regulator n=1 Tax=Entotheonella factor TaxID=1429438 RepID=W4L5B5_ENTF1|nr:MAG: hypothetical protein ETSY1_43235 [Candidatus Entotheonella factor]